MLIELTSIPSGQTDRISGFVAGAEIVLRHMPNHTGNDPMKIDLEFRESGNCHIYLNTGRWVDGETGAIEEYKDSV